MAEYNNVRSQLNAINRKQAGRYFFIREFFVGHSIMHPT